MRTNSSFALLIFMVTLAIGAALAYACYVQWGALPSAAIGAVAFILAISISNWLPISGTGPSSCALANSTRSRGRGCFS
jgi:hypothetical protein